MIDVRQPLEPPAGGFRNSFSLSLLERSGIAISRLPVSLRVVPLLVDLAAASAEVRA